MGKAMEDQSQQYVDRCLNALIVALEDPLAHWDENFLVAVILLRLHEEMGDADEQCHHFGASGLFSWIYTDHLAPACCMFISSYPNHS